MASGRKRLGPSGSSGRVHDLPFGMQIAVAINRPWSLPTELKDASMYLDRYRESIIAWVTEGLSDRKIAERVRVSPSTVRYWRERNGIERPIRGAVLDAS